MPIPDVAPIQNPYGPLITFRTEDILPPSAIYVGPQDAIVIESLTPNVGATVTIAYRLLRTDGKVINTIDSFSFLNGAGFGAHYNIQPSEGFLLSMVVFAVGALLGQVFIRVYLASDAQSGWGTPAHVLAQGYCTGIDVLTFPQPSIESSLGGRGWVHTVPITAAAGADATWTVPANTNWIVLAVYFQFIASAAVLNRVLGVFVFDNAGSIASETTFPTVVPAGQFSDCTAAPGNTNSNNVFWQSTGLPMNLRLRPGWQVVVTWSPKDAADQMQALRLTVEEFVGQ